MLESLLVLPVPPVSNYLMEDMSLLSTLSVQCTLLSVWCAVYTLLELRGASRLSFLGRCVALGPSGPRRRIELSKLPEQQ